MKTLNYKKRYFKYKNENIQIKSDILELKQIILNKKNEQQQIFKTNILDQLEKPTDEKLYKQSIELAEKVKREKLTTIELPQYLKNVPDSLFKECTELKTVKIPSSVTEIGDSAFRECSSLTQITIPSSVTSIGNYSFDGCNI